MGHVADKPPETVKLLIRPELQPGRGRQSRVDKSSARHKTSLAMGHTRDHRPTAQQCH
jgi:hypothetical protein